MANSSSEHLVKDLIDEFGRPVFMLLATDGREVDRKIGELEAKGFVFRRFNPHGREKIYSLINPKTRQLAIVNGTY